LDVDIQLLAVEFFYVVGEILETGSIDATKYRYIDTRRINTFLKEDKE